MQCAARRAQRLESGDGFQPRGPCAHCTLRQIRRPEGARCARASNDECCCAPPSPASPACCTSPHYGKVSAFCAIFCAPRIPCSLPYAALRRIFLTILTAARGPLTRFFLRSTSHGPRATCKYTSSACSGSAGQKSFPNCVKNMFQVLSPTKLLEKETCVESVGGGEKKECGTWGLLLGERRAACSRKAGWPGFG